MAEYIAAAAATKEALWIRKLLEDLGEPISTINNGEDNKARLAKVDDS